MWRVVPIGLIVCTCCGMEERSKISPETMEGLIESGDIELRPINGLPLWSVRRSPPIPPPFPNDDEPPSSASLPVEPSVSEEEKKLFSPSSLIQLAIQNLSKQSKEALKKQQFLFDVQDVRKISDEGDIEIETTFKRGSFKNVAPHLIDEMVYGASERHNWKSAIYLINKRLKRIKKQYPDQYEQPSKSETEYIALIEERIKQFNGAYHEDVGSFLSKYPYVLERIYEYYQNKLKAPDWWYCISTEKGVLTPGDRYDARYRLENRLIARSSVEGLDGQMHKYQAGVIGQTGRKQVRVDEQVGDHWVPINDFHFHNTIPIRSVALHAFSDSSILVAFADTMYLRYVLFKKKPEESKAYTIYKNPNIQGVFCGNSGKCIGSVAYISSEEEEVVENKAEVCLYNLENKVARIFPTDSCKTRSIDFGRECIKGMAISGIPGIFYLAPALAYAYTGSTSGGFYKEWVDYGWIAWVATGFLATSHSFIRYLLHKVPVEPRFSYDPERQIVASKFSNQYLAVLGQRWDNGPTKLQHLQKMAYVWACKVDKVEKPSSDVVTQLLKAPVRTLFDKSKLAILHTRLKLAQLK